MDSRQGYQPEDDIADRPAIMSQAELEAELDADEIAVAAGRLIPLEPVLARMRATVERVRRARVTKETAKPQEV